MKKKSLKKRNLKKKVNEQHVTSGYGGYGGGEVPGGSPMSGPGYQGGIFHSDVALQIPRLRDQESALKKRYGLGDDEISMDQYPGQNKEIFYTLLTFFRKTQNNTLRTILLQAINGQDEKMLRWYEKNY